MTGAGVSAESGIPTFRDALEGLWSRFDPQDLATPDAFRRDPALVTRWYDERRINCAKCRPNAAHKALARWERHAAGLGARFTLITQNVDRLHQRAGSRRVIELHGSLFEWRCAQSGEVIECPPDAFGDYPPTTPSGGVARPGVVWFGEMLPDDAVAAADDAAGSCDLFVSVGTSAVVYPAAGYLHLADAAGARTLEINREPTPASGVVNWSIQGNAGDILPAFVAAAIES